MSSVVQKMRSKRYPGKCSRWASVSRASSPNHSKLHDAVCQRKRHTGSHYFRRAKRLRKSTITEAIVNIPGQFSGEYINADDIARLLQDPISDDHRRNIKAAQIAQERRLQALHEGRDFAFETVMSTPEKVALIIQ